MTEEIRQRTSIKIRGRDGRPTLVFNPKPWITPMQGARCAQLLPMLFHGPSRDIPWHDIVNEWGLTGHFDAEPQQEKVEEPKPETPAA